MSVSQYVGKGIITITHYDGTGTPIDLGNVLDLKLAISESVKEQKNMRDAGGGLATSSRRIDKVELTITLGELNPDNLALATAGGFTIDGTTQENIIELFTTSAALYRVDFAGLNELDGGSSVAIVFYKVRFGPASSLDLLGDEISTGVLKATVERDNTITGAGLSKFGKITTAPTV